MEIKSKTKEGRGWERQFKELTVRFYELKEIIHNAQRNFGLGSCKVCGNLKELDQECIECGDES